MNKACLKRALLFLGFSGFCTVFHLVYSCFSHGIRSPYMTYAWVLPLFLGTVVYGVCGLIWPLFPAGIATFLYNAGISTLTVGSLVQGILAIADASSALMPVSPVLGGAFVLAGAVLQLLALLRIRKK